MALTNKEAVERIGQLEESNCHFCKIRSNSRKKGVPEKEILEYCITKCQVGKKIRALGGVLEYGKIANGHLKAPDLTKEKYIELHNQKLTDSEIREKYGISRVTLSRRKRAWKLNNDKRYTTPGAVLVDLTKEELQNLVKDYTNKEIADMKGVSADTIHKRRKMWGIDNSASTIVARFTKGEYLYLSKKKRLIDSKIAELWEISLSSLLILKNSWELIEKRKTPEEVGLTPEILKKIAPYKTDKEIASEWDLKPTTVTKFRKKEGVSYKERLPINRIKAADLKPLLDQRISRSEIARRLGIDRKTVTRILNKK